MDGFNCPPSLFPVLNVDMMPETEAALFAVMKERPGNHRVTDPDTADLLRQYKQFPSPSFLLSEKKIANL